MPFAHLTDHPRAEESFWERRVCCLIQKNGTVKNDLRPVLPKHDPVSVNTDTNFTLNCFLDEKFSEPLLYPYNVTRGQIIYCIVEAHVWDTRLLLVVPSCHFWAQKYRAPSFEFINNKLGNCKL